MSRYPRRSKRRGNRRRFKHKTRRPRGQSPLYNYKRSIFLKDALIVAAGNPDTALAYTATMTQLPNVTDFSNLYDSYMIKKVVVKIIPKFTNVALASGATTQNTNLQQIHSVIDYDDGVAPGSINDLVQYHSYRMTRGHVPHTRTFVPKVELVETNTGGGGGGQAAKAYQWCDFDNINTAHRGMKFIIPSPTVTGTTVYYDQLITYYFSCKNVV